jgi:hypothetical protein
MDSNRLVEEQVTIDGYSSQLEARIIMGPTENPLSKEALVVSKNVHIIIIVAASIAD